MAIKKHSQKKKIKTVKLKFLLKNKYAGDKSKTI